MPGLRLPATPPRSELARLQQFLVLAAAAAVAVWCVRWLPGSPGVALTGLVALPLGYALVLGVEFLLLARVNRQDPAPPSSAAQRLRAWMGECLHGPLVFCWRQPFRSRQWADHVPGHSHGRRGVVLVHGFVCNRGLWNRWYPRLRVLGIPHIGVDLQPVFGDIDDYAQTIDEAVHRLTTATGLAPVVVAHSMGGLAVRQWWSTRPSDALCHLVTIGTPHRGTWLARFATSSNTRQMRVDSPWQAALVGREDRRRARQMTCFYSHCDNVVFPASTATMPAADNRHLSATAHVRMADHPAPFLEVVHRVLVGTEDAGQPAGN